LSRSRILYTVIAVQAVVIGYLALNPSQPAAMAQVPDSGLQLQQIIEQSKQTNAKLDKIVGILESGKLQVKVVAEKAE
jgi:hypothetical protein